MQSRYVLIFVAILASIGGHFGSTLLQGGAANAQHTVHQQSGSGSAWEHGDAFARALAAGMDKMHHEMMRPQPTGNADVDFLATMIPHHAGAVEMARLVLIHGKDPLVRRLAEEIIAGQQAEITAMEARLSILRKGDDPMPEGYPPLGGTRGNLN
jgi:uncharacterized protein (DUF305 family)